MQVRHTATHKNPACLRLPDRWRTSLKLIGVRTDAKYFYIVTDQGERKVTLTWKGIPAIKAKCLDLLGKNITTETWGNFDNNVWFSDLSEAKREITNKDDYENINVGTFPLGREFANQESKKIYGPPGTGKTFQLISLVKQALRDGVSPNDIAFIAFSNEAANVAKERIAKEFPALGQGAFTHFSTIHSFATRLGGTLGQKLCQEEDLKEFDKHIECSTEWASIGDPSSIVFRYRHPILDRYSLAISRQEDMDFSEPAKFRNQSREALRLYFNFKVPGNFIAAQDFWNENYARYCRTYIKEFLEFKRAKNLIVFDDVISKVASSSFPKGQIPTFELLIVDEAQDLSKHLWSFVNRLVLQAKKTFVAGDDDQAIMRGFGAAPEMFVNFKATEPDELLQNSRRVPKAVWKHVENGIIPILDENPNRVEKSWLSRDFEGEVVVRNKQTNKTLQLDDLILEIRLDYLFHTDFEAFIQLAEANGKFREQVGRDKLSDGLDWLVMTPTRSTSETVSGALREFRIPHFLRRKPVLDAKEGAFDLSIQTIHTSKGAEAVNTAIVFQKFGDVTTVVNNPQLAYVALTRSRERMFPMIIKDGLLGDLDESDSYKNYSSTFIKMFDPCF